MRLENVQVPPRGHLETLYSVKFENDDFKDASPAFEEFVRTVIPGANALTIRQFTRKVRKVYASDAG